MSNFNSVLIVGSTGNLGQVITQGFLDSIPKWNVFLLVRPTSAEDPKKKSLLDLYVSKGAALVHGEIEKPDTYQDKLKGIQVVVSVASREGLYQQTHLIQACKAAGVKVLVPSEWGMDYSKSNPLTVIFNGQRKIREELKKGGLDYIIVETGLFYEYFSAPHFGFHIANKKVPLFGERDTKVSASALSDVAALLPFIVNDPTLYNTQVSLSGEQSTSGHMFDEMKAVIGGEVETVHYKVDELISKIKNAPSPFASVLEQVALVVADGSSYNPNVIDGKKHGKPLSSFHEFCQSKLKK